MKARRYLSSPRLCWWWALGAAAASVATGLAATAPSPAFALRSGDRVVFLGDALIECEQRAGWIETMLTARFAGSDVTFRNLGWSGDTPAGDSRVGLSLLQAGHEPPGEGWKLLVQQLTEVRPTVVILGYGMAASFAGDDGLARFTSDYRRLLETIATTLPGARAVLLGPLRHEDLGEPWPDPAPHNRRLARYDAAVRALALERRLPSVSWFDFPSGADATPLTWNGIHPTDAGLRRIAERIEQELFADAGPWRTSAGTEALRQAIRRKNEWFFHRSRPGNMAYIFGFRKREQGKNAGEMPAFDPLIAAEEKRIAALRALQPATVPEVSRRRGSLRPAPTEQPRPSFTVADELEVTLWAENPLLHKPVQMNFDAQGRLWIASSELYPQIEPGQEATDKIVVLADTTGRGRADQAVVFADGLLIPTGVAPGDGGAYVAQSTELLFLRDTDGDGRADERRVVLSGFGTEDTHHNLHTLRWGPDGALYMNQSTYTRSVVETPHGVVALKAGGIFRLDPRDERLDVIARGWANPWGHQFDDHGQSFVTDGAGFLGLSWVVPGASYAGLRPGGRVLPTIAAGRYPKFCGLEIVRGPHFPADWQGDFITCDFRAHRVVRFKVSAQGAGFATREMPDLLRTTDVAFRPIDVRQGPDGALYVADWSNPIIQHGEVDFRDPRRDREHGRIWRIAAKGRPPQPVRNLAAQPTRALLDALTAPDGYTREQARRLLLERGAPVLPELAAWRARATDDGVRLEAARLHRALRAPEPELEAALLRSADPEVRVAMIQIGPAASQPFDALAALANDEHPRVRLAAVRALAAFKDVRAADAALRALDRPLDPFLDYALWLTLRELAAPWLAAVKSGAWPVAGRERQLEFGLRAVEPALAGEVLAHLLETQTIPADGSGPWIELIGTAGGAAEAGRLLARALQGDMDEAATIKALAALGEAARLRDVQPPGDLARLAGLLRAPSAMVRVAALVLAGTWKVAALTPGLLSAAGRAGATAHERAAAFEALREIRGPAVLQGLRALAATGADATLRREALIALASVDLAAGLPEIMKSLRATTEETEAQKFWRELLGVPGAAAAVAKELQAAAVAPLVARAGLRPARESGQGEVLVPLLLKQAGLSLANSRLSTEEIQALARDAVASGDPARGELVYRRAELACVACHAIGGAGSHLGPDLTSIGASAPADYLVESLLYPSARIKEGYHAVRVTTRDARELSGMVVRETADELVLRDAAGRETAVPLRTVASRRGMDSLMPAGLIDGLLPEERRDLIAFLARLGRPGEFDASRSDTARTWNLYVVVSRNQHLGIERVVHGDFSLASWVPALTLTNGTLPKSALEAAYPAKGINTRGLFAATSFHAAREGVGRFTVDGEAKEIWINGRPVSPGRDFSGPVRAGANLLVLRLDDVQVPDGIRVCSGDVTFANEP